MFHVRKEVCSFLAVAPGCQRLRFRTSLYGMPVKPVASRVDLGTPKTVAVVRAAQAAAVES